MFGRCDTGRHRGDFQDSQPLKCDVRFEGISKFPVASRNLGLSGSQKFKTNLGHCFRKGSDLKIKYGQIISNIGEE